MLQIAEKLLVGGRWVEGGPPLEVRNKYSGQVIATLPIARPEYVDDAIAEAAKAAPVMAALPAHRRSAILAKTASLLAAPGKAVSGARACAMPWKR